MNTYLLTCPSESNSVKLFLYEISALRNDWREPCLPLVGAGPESDGTTS
jgi:hypothetical protein